MLTNKVLSKQEIELLEFFVDKIQCQKEAIINQINQAKIIKDCSRYRCIFNFQHFNSSLSLDLNYKFDSHIQILHDDGTAPTVFTMLVRNGRISMIEVYNADSSELSFERIHDGRLIFEL